jgi:LmbE family N-acetylglucosaminyl deacetylase
MMRVKRFTMKDYPQPLKLMAVLAHPDDESLAMGGVLTKYAAGGIQTYLVMATRGERGWFGPGRRVSGSGSAGAAP